MNRVQSANMIRFYLSQLPARNGAHVFEELCRQLARMRIASNVVPATGPVGAGGDQGRDFETFRTYLAASDLAPTTFIGRATDKTLAFSCTLQQDRLPEKIETDVAKVLAGGHGVDGVYVFTERNIPVGVRHEIEKEMSEKHGIEVHVLDGEWIAEQLGDPETFWIAEQYLGVPSQFYPEPLDERPATWYEELRDEWRARTGVSGSFGEYSALRRGIRYSGAQPEAQADLPFWSGWLERLITVADRFIARRAVYELAVSSLRLGRGTLRGHEERLREYMEEAIASSDPGTLQDGQIMVTFMGGADQRGLIDLREGELAELRDRLEAQVRAVHARTDDPSVRAQLLQTAAHVHFLPAPPYGQPEPERITTSFATLEEALADAENGPLFPIDEFAQHMTLMTPFIVDLPGYEAFVTKMDDLVAKRMGRASAAERARDRAVALHDAGRLTAALREFHRVRVDWFAGDTVRGSLLAMAMISQIYHQLHLHQASKYYALGFAHLALNLGDETLLDMVPRGVLQAAQADYESGALVSYIGLCDTGLRLRYRIEGHHPGYIRGGGQTLYGLVVLKAYSSLHDPELDGHLAECLRGLDVLEEVEQVIFDAAARDPWKERQAFADHYAAEMGVAAFSDAGPEREISWRALGLTWRVRFKNEYATTRAAERFCAFAQILLADMADVDLALLPTYITIELKATGATSAEVQPSNEGRVWDIEVPTTISKDEVVDQAVEAIAAVTSILLEASLLPVERANDAIERIFREGITNKLLPSVSFDSAYTQFIPEKDFDVLLREGRTPLVPAVRPTPPQHEELAWHAGPGPTYTAEEAREKLGWRYQRSPQSIRFTLPRLLADPRTRALIEDLRREGWLDWRILGALSMRAMNWRVEQTDPRTISDYKSTLLRLMRDPEPVDAPLVPLAIFNRESLVTVDNANVTSTLKTWDLDLRQRTPDIRAIRQFLNERYRQDKDDIDHDDPFSVEANRLSPA